MELPAGARSRQAPLGIAGNGSPRQLPCKGIDGGGGDTAAASRDCHTPGPHKNSGEKAQSWIPAQQIPLQPQSTEQTGGVQFSQASGLC